ncbi:MAG: hypothetical protein U0931_30880 [Vulcanimicrobiota bacterium]
MGKGVALRKRGMALGLAMLCAMMLFMMGATYLSVVHSDLRFQSLQHRTSQAQYLVWSGLEFYVSSKADPTPPIYNTPEGLTLDWGSGRRVWLRENDSDGSVEAAGILVDEHNRELLRRTLRMQREVPTSGSGWAVPVNWRGATVAPQI